MKRGCRRVDKDVHFCMFTRDFHTVGSKIEPLKLLVWRSKSDIDPKEPKDGAVRNPLRLHFLSKPKISPPDLFDGLEGLLLLPASPPVSPNKRFRPRAESFRSSIVRGAFVVSGSDCDKFFKLKESFRA